jgi:phosphopantothenoylcysteine decarboxylase/phosphopantothenate--cysteine ligase
MSEPDEIARVALSVMAGSQDLVGRRVLVSAGGTREPLDPVRYIGNRSSGRQGLALAVAAAARGADVTLVAANLELAVPQGISVVHVSTTRELERSMSDLSADADTVIMAAAVSDYRPDSVASTKIKKDVQGDALTLNLVKNPDILRGLVDRREAGQTIVGFAAETEPDREALLALGRAKVARKGCDYLVLNTVGWSEGFATEDNSVVVIDSAGDIVGEATGTKRSVADRILDVLSARP